MEKITLPEGTLERKGDIIEIKHNRGMKIKADIKELSSWMIRQLRKEIVRDPKKEL